MNKNLKSKNLTTVEFSIDKVGKLYFYQDRVFRAINKPYIAQVQEMFDCGMMDELIEKKLFINSWISDFEIKGYNLIIEHTYIKYWNYPYEWSFNMIKDAANTVLNINTIANKYGFELFDVHAFNVVYDMSQPKYVDLGSFFKIEKANAKSWTGYLHFYNSFYMPLYLYSKGFSDLSQSIFLFNGYFSTKDFFLLKYKYLNLFGSKINNLIYKLYYNSRRLAVARHFKVIEKYGKHKYINYILNFKKYFQNRFNANRSYKLIKQVKKNRSDSYWKDYHNNLNPESDNRFLSITQLIKTELKDANTLIEVASNQGKFADFVLQKTQINEIIATDYDKNAVDRLYLNNRNNKNILPIIYDIVRPNGRSCDKKIENRISADIVMGLAVTHHLILTQEINLDHIFKVFERLTNKYIVIEFMPLGLYSGNIKNIPPIPDYYTLKWFKTSFSKRFEYILDKEIGVNRHLFVGKIKGN